MPTKRERWSPRNWRVRTKLLAVLLIPAIAAVVLGGVQINSDLRALDDLGRTVKQVDMGVRTSDLVHELQRERELMSGFVATSRTGDRTSLDAQKRRVDNLVTSVRSAGGDLADLDDLVRSSYQQAVASLNGLATLREVAETTQYSDQAVITSYSAMITTLLDLRREVSRAPSSSQVVDLAGAADALGRAKEQVAQQHAVLLVASLGDSLPPNDVQAVRVADSRYTAALAEFFSIASSDDRQRYADTVTGPEVDLRERIKQTAVSRAAINESPEIDLQQWDSAAGSTADLINEVESGLNQRLTDAAGELRQQAVADVVRDAVILLVALLATLLLVIVVARSMLVPLRTLRDTAFDVADRKLPDAIRRIRDTDDVDVAVEPVAVRTREEFGQVARAFDAVHGEAVRLAAEQSLLRRNINDMFVNLSRRSQGLVERQLRLIDQLENSEQDPEQLSNLFQLDHLATRMRRNSENLLVLAGAELARRSTRPVPTVDVLRAAVSEVEEYQRVVVQTPPTVNVLGLAVNDLVHLVAELLDNATTFSPPQSRVIIASSLTDAGDLVIEIADQGVGMAYPQLVEANQRLAEPPVVDVAVSRRMGLFVVGRLATRHGVSVRLGGNEGEPGLTAVVTVPADLVQAGELTELGPRTDQVPAQRASEDFLQTTILPAQTYDEPAVADTTAAWPSTWQQAEQAVEPEPRRAYPATGPVQLDLDSISGADLFSPASVPSMHTPARADEYDPYGYDERGEWPSHDHDVAHDGHDRRHDDVPAAEQTLQQHAYPAEWADSVSTPYDDAPVPAAVGAVAARDELGMSAPPQPVSEPAETTPIYEEMVSAWFRELSAPAAPAAARPAPTYIEPPPFEMPAAAGATTAVATATGRRAEPARGADRPDLSDPAFGPGLRGRHSAGQSGGGSEPPRREPARPEQRPEQRRPEPARAETPRAPEPPRAEPRREPEPALARADEPESNGSDVWRSPGDDGWRAAGALATASNSNGFTAAGLPKRRRGAHLVPGAAGATAQPAAPVAAGPRRARSADDVRGRLASYQQGLRQGRDARRDLAHASLDPGSEHAAPHGTNEESQ